MTVVTIVGIGAASVVGLMLILWLIHLATGNASIVDPGWAGGLAILGILYATLGGGYGLRATLVALMAGIWGFRLAIYLLVTRVIGHPEEGRYQQLRREWKTNIAFKFLMFYEFQAVLAIVMAIPFLTAARNFDPAISPLEYAGAALWVVAMLGEMTADAQLSAFKANPANKGHTCQAGLWHYSRHPNYFFEWLIWMAFAVFALASPWGWLGLISPALILYFLLRVTGIPATEAQALRSRGDEYRRYQKTTSVFVPWFPRKVSE